MTWIRALVILAALAAPAAAWQPGELVDHGHTASGDGGLLTEVSSLTVNGVLIAGGTIQAPVVISTEIRSPGYFVLVASASLREASSYGLLSLTATTYYRLDYNLTKTGGAGYARLRFNGAGGTYTSLAYKVNAAAAAAEAATDCPLTDDASDSNSGRPIYGSTHFETAHSSPSHVLARYNSFDYTSGGDNLEFYTGVCHAQLSAALSSVTLHVTAGGVSGSIWLYKRIPAEGFQLSSGALAGNIIPEHTHDNANQGGAEISPSTVTTSNLCVDNGATACGTIKAGDSTGGKVGIGSATNPSIDLHLTNLTNGEKIRVNGSASSAGLGVNANGAGWATGIYNAGAIQGSFISRGLALGSYANASNPPADTLIVDNLGVGTASPGTKLDVNGAATIRGQQTILNSSQTITQSGTTGNANIAGWKRAGADTMLWYFTGPGQNLSLFSYGSSADLAIFPYIGDPYFPTGIHASSATISSSVDAKGLMVKNTARAKIGIQSALNNGIYLAMEDTSGEVAGFYCDRDASRTCRLYTNVSNTAWTVEVNQAEKLLVDVNGVRPVRPGTQNISAGGTITADACGGVKRVATSGAVTTNTTNSFTAPATANDGCCMDVVLDQASTGDLTIDANSNFVTPGGADVVLTPTVGAAGRKGARVCSDSGKWYLMDN